jgi:hypothetical protein
MRYAAERFLPFFTLPRLYCRAATKSMTLPLAALGAGASRFCPFAFDTRFLLPQLSNSDTPAYLKALRHLKATRPSVFQKSWS